VPGGPEIVPVVNRLLAVDWRRIDASQDWHPPDHCSFAGQRDNLYPPHCVMGTRGAEFLPGLATDRFHAVWRKGFNRFTDAYAVTAQHPGMLKLYQNEGIAVVIVCGLATNICCYFAARDFRWAGFRVLIAEDASAGVDVPAANLWQDRTRAEGLRKGLEYVTADTILAVVR
jgi:nicotinamidase/pyrazinamidase